MYSKSIVATAAVLVWAGTHPMHPLAQSRGVDPRPANAPSQKPAFPGQTDTPEGRLGVAFDVVTVVDGLRNPWGMAWLPSGRMLVTERIGYLRVVNADGTLVPGVVNGLPA